MGAVFLREFKSRIRNLRSVISITVFVLLSGLLFTLNNIRLTYPTIDAVIATISLLAAVTIPLISGFSDWSDRKSNCDMFFAVLPVSAYQIVLGKFFADFALFMIPNAVISLYPVILGFFGATSYVYSYSAILFLLLFESFFISLTLMFASIFKKSWQALIVTYGSMTVLFILGSFSTFMPDILKTICRFISPFRQFDAIVYGKFELSSVIFFLAFSVLFLFIASKYYFRTADKYKRTKFRVSLASVILSVAVLAVCILSALLPPSLRWIDVTPNKLYKINTTTDRLFDTLDCDINVYLIDADNSEPKLISFLEKYCSRSQNVVLKKIDTSKDTEFRTEHGLTDDQDLRFCLIVESERRERLISADTLFKWYNNDYPDFGYMSATELQSAISSLDNFVKQYSPYYSSMSGSDKEKFNNYVTMYQSLYYLSTRYMNVESVINHAIEYVTADVIPTFYFVSGHGEKNTQGGPLNLTQITRIPPEASMLVINTPDNDYSAAEADMLIEYINNGGRLIVFTKKANNSMSNLMRVLASTGLYPDVGNIDADNKTYTATVNTSSKALSLLANEEDDTTLDMIGAYPILKDTQNGVYEYTTLFSTDVEVIENEDKFVEVREFGIAVTKDDQPVLTWLTGSDTFNRDQNNLEGDDQKKYITAMYGVSSLISWMSKTYSPSLPDVTPVAYDIVKFLDVEEKDVSLVGVVTIAVIPLIILGSGMCIIYLRRKHSVKNL